MDEKLYAKIQRKRTRLMKMLLEYPCLCYKPANRPVCVCGYVCLSVCVFMLVCICVWRNRFFRVFWGRKFSNYYEQSKSSLTFISYFYFEFSLWKLRLRFTKVLTWRHFSFRHSTAGSLLSKKHIRHERQFLLWPFFLRLHLFLLFTRAAMISFAKHIASGNYSVTRSPWIIIVWAVRFRCEKIESEGEVHVARCLQTCRTLSLVFINRSYFESSF